MKAIELRLNNLVHNAGKALCRVASISETLIETKGVNSSDYDKVRKIQDIVPIKLNNDWLKRLGFEYIEELGGFADADHVIFAEIDDSFIFMPCCTNDIDCYIKVEFVHELQNTYYTNTKKKELILK